MIHLLRKLRQLAGAGHGGSVCNKRRQDLGIATLRVRMGVQEKVNHRALQTGAHTAIKMKTGTGHLAGDLRQQDPLVRANVPMCLRLKVELLGLAPTADLRVASIVRARRYLVRRNVRDAEQGLFELCFHIGTGRIQLLDFRGNPLHLRHNRRGVLARLLHLRNLLGYLVLLCLQGFHLADNGLALVVKCKSLVNCRIVASAAQRQTLLDLCRVFPDKFNV